MNFLFLPLKLINRKLQSRGPDASLDTHIDCLDQLWRLWQLWPYRHNGHIRVMAIAAIDAIVEPGH